MHFLDKKMRLLVSIFGSVGVAGLVLTTVTSASAAPVRTTAPTATGTTFVLRGTAVGGIKTIQNGQTLTFLFTETNKGSRSVPEDLVLTEVTNVTVVGGLTCVLPNGFAINADGFFCEPGLVSPGQSASSVITTNVTGSSGSTASARLCLDNENTGFMGPCKTVSVNIA